jgi:hypothetical protein
MILILPNGSSVYFIFGFINSLSFPPVSGAKDADHAIPIGKSNGKNPVSNFSKTVVAFFIVTMRYVFCYYTTWVSKSILGIDKRYAMLFLVFQVFAWVPLKMCFDHEFSLS